MMTRVKTSQEIVAMREGGRMLATVLQNLKSSLKPNVSTKQLADTAASQLKKLGGKPAFLGYHGFPDVLCVSVNDEVIHGIPRADKVLKEGDVVSLDFGVQHKGLITDAAITTIVGDGKSRDKLLIEATEKALNIGLNMLKADIRVGDMSEKIQQILNSYGLGIVYEYVGHGVGDNLHEEPNIPNLGSRGNGPILKNGFTIAVEPMATLGSGKTVVDGDNWTVRTKDGSRAAHFEHTVYITEEGCEILTKFE